MDMDRFDDVVRTFASTSSRRAINRAAVSLTAWTFIALLARVPTTSAKNGKHRHNHGWHKKKKRKKKSSDRCPKQYAYCPAEGFSECCRVAPDPDSFDPPEVCTSCGCCAVGFQRCCPARAEAVCCRDDNKCCFSDDLNVAACCGGTDVCCGAGCCDSGESCCQTTGGEYYCCEKDLACLKTGGFTCTT